MREREREQVGTYFEVGKGSVHSDTPINQTIRSVNNSIIVKFDESFRDRFRQFRVHRERNSIPITRNSQSTNLIRNSRLIPTRLQTPLSSASKTSIRRGGEKGGKDLLFFPSHTTFEELFTSQIMSREVFEFHESFLYD